MAEVFAQSIHRSVAMNLLSRAIPSWRSSVDVAYESRTCVSAVCMPKPRPGVSATWASCSARSQSLQEVSPVWLMSG